MTEMEAAQAQLREIVRDLKAVKYRMRGAQASMPLSPAERDPDADVDTLTDPLAAFHGDMEHLLDEIDALILKLGETAGSRPRECP